MRHKEVAKMNIEPANKINIAAFDTTNKPVNKMECDSTLSPTPSLESSETQQTIEEANRLVQTIITQLSGLVLRKLPASEYMKLMSVLDTLVSSSINEQV